MVETQGIIVCLEEDHKVKLRDLIALAGIEIRPEVLNIIIHLLALGTAPSSLTTVLAAISRPPGAAVSVRQNLDSTGRR